jgi:two-component system, NtrC family, response regulator AtoC
LCSDGAIRPEHLPFDGPAPPPAAPAASLRDEVAAAERRRIVEALEQCDGNQTRAAKALGISRRTLVARLGEYGIPRPRAKK